MNGTSTANISDINRAEVHEGGDVTLTFTVEAYPPIRRHHWTTPMYINYHDDTVFQESYTTNGYR